jgi:hypothetical protein
MIGGVAAVLVGAQIVQLGLFARTYAVLYVGDSDPVLERAWLRIRLEHGLLLGLALFVAGSVILATIFVEWARGGFGTLAREHEGLLGVLLVALGVQVIFSSFFLSVLGARREGVRNRATAPAREAPAELQQTARN